MSIANRSLTLIWHCDAGHEWLCVNRADLIEMDLHSLKKISAYSYRTKLSTFVYLEGDCDAGIFLDHCKRQGIAIEQRFEDHGDYASVRSLPRYDYIKVLAMIP